MHEPPWINEFTNAIPAPKPSKFLVSQVKSQMRQILQKELSPKQMRKVILWTIAVTVVTLPFFLGLNYWYYLFLNSFFASWLSPAAANLALLVFLAVSSFLGAAVYSIVPIATFFWLRNSQQAAT